MVPSSAAESIQKIINSLLAFGANDTLLVALGGRLLVYLTVIAVAWAAIKILMEGEGINKLVVEFVAIVLLWGFASLFVSESGRENLGVALIDGFDWIAKEILTASAAVGGARVEDPAQSVLAIMSNTFQVANNLFSDKELAGQRSSGLSLVTMGATEFFYLIANTLMRLATLLFVLVSTVLFVGQFIFTQIMVKIGFLVMPILVPFIMLEKTRPIFDGWIKFMISAGFIKIVGAFLYGLLVGNVNEAINVAKSATVGESNAVAFYVYATLFLLTGIMAYIMAQTQSIGNALASGIASGGFSFRTPQVNLRMPRISRGGK